MTCDLHEIPFPFHTRRADEPTQYLPARTKIVWPSEGLRCDIGDSSALGLGRLVGVSGGEWDSSSSSLGAR